MTNTFTIQNEFADTISRYVSREIGKGKDPRRSMARIMVDWLFQAMKHTPPSGTDEIVQYLMQKARVRSTTTRRKRAKVVNDMKDTMALVIIRHNNYKGARSLSNLELSKLAKKFVSRRVFSAGLLKSGFFPAIRALRKNPKQRGPDYKKSPTGRLTPFAYSSDGITLAATNFAKKIAEIYPNAFEDGMSSVSSRFATYLADDMAAELAAAELSKK